MSALLPTIAIRELSATNEKLNLVLIYGSIREGRYCDIIANWASAQVRKHQEFALEIVDPAKLSLQPQSEQNPDLHALRTCLDRADAFIVITPEYNHGYPAPLKHLIDSVSREWQAKPLAFVSYGGVSGGLRAVEQLRQVFAELHVATMRNSVSFANAWEQFDDQGRLYAATRAEKSMEMMLAQLHWWAVALKDARRTIPYGIVAT
ncbi:MAG: NAD(P)H-dependent oxidoreductase [Burkholderiaceae bacterium]|uniref:NAD(P)H-dependent oxidoreductase n=1 Tax=Herminiimonas contaminans TaxID=1111140 RepID=A0ABS0EWV4_9BURK|nr:NAD(P)H-dependent oxidoreductase [Herminiimonas contaminans]MBF8178983.1 NAD(P)H-dependent oxidoreductase [Herminiimonas contaminans]MBX9800699.1 NAD(P)H-dependent oxidoreductase [Burkholderiaceae bacterium]